MEITRSRGVGDGAKGSMREVSVSSALVTVTL